MGRDHEIAPAMPRVGQILKNKGLTPLRFKYKWDLENRLIHIESKAIPGIPDVYRNAVVFKYDAFGRRVSKTVTNWNTFTLGWSATSVTTKYLYDGWNLIAEVNASDNSTLRSYVWGLDRSETSKNDAGGVGGLLWMIDSSGKYSYVYDGNGNVMGLVKGTGTVEAQYEYGPFGEPMTESGSIAQVNPFRFSTKFFEIESGLYYYGYRFYDSKTGRWLSRDPLQEADGMSLVSFVKNNPLNKFDRLGLFAYRLGSAKQLFFCKFVRHLVGLAG